MDRGADASQLQPSQVDQLDPGHRPQHVGRRGAHQNPATVSRTHQPGRPVQRRPEIVAVTFVGLARVQSHADAQLEPGRPRFAEQRTLRLHRRGHRVARSTEGHRDTIAATREHETLVSRHGVPKDVVVTFQRLSHLARKLIPPPRRVLHVREQERHRSGRPRQLHTISIAPNPTAPRPAQSRRPLLGPLGHPIGPACNALTERGSAPSPCRWLAEEQCELTTKRKRKEWTTAPPTAQSANPSAVSPKWFRSGRSNYRNAHAVSSGHHCDEIGDPVAGHVDIAVPEHARPRPDQRPPRTPGRGRPVPCRPPRGAPSDRAIGRARVDCSAEDGHVSQAFQLHNPVELASVTDAKGW